MTKLRHVPSESSPFPVAAEVCETRELLSAGAAVHSALNHAQVASHAAPAPATTGPILPVSVRITVETVTPDVIISPGQMTISAVVPRIGAFVKVHISTAFNSPGNANVLSISLSGRIQTVTPQPTTTNVQVAPVGALKITQTTATGRVIHFTYKPTNPLSIRIDGTGNPLALVTTFVHHPIHNIPIAPIKIQADLA
jgi:hypothetical protein